MTNIHIPFLVRDMGITSPTMISLVLMGDAMSARIVALLYSMQCLSAPLRRPKLTSATNKTNFSSAIARTGTFWRSESCGRARGKSSKQQGERGWRV